MDTNVTKGFLDPKISIIIPFFNSEKTLKRTILSVITQEEFSAELILVNDGSQDSSNQIAQSFNASPRISFFSQKNQGVSAARNLGAEKAKGNWLFFLDSDDYIENNSLSFITSQIIQDSNQSFYIFGINRIKSNYKVTQLPESGKYFSKLAGTFVIKKSVFDQVGGYDQNLAFSENTELFHRISLAGFTGKSVQKVILNYSENPTGGSKNLQNMIDSLTIILDKHNETLSPHVKHLYHQIIGVNWMRFRNFSQARHHLLNAVKYKPTKMATWGRFGLACFPILAKFFYSETVKYD